MDRLFDLHAHPSLKMYYLPYLTRTFHAALGQERFWNPLNFQTQYGNLKGSPVRAICCAHYVIEASFLSKGIKQLGRTLAWALAPAHYNRMRRADPWVTLQGMMETLEEAITNTNRRVKGGGKRLRLVTRFADLEGLAADEIALMHAIEGAHALGERAEGVSKEAFWEQTKERLASLKQRGVCMIGLSHFFDNEFAPQIDSTEIVPRVMDGRVIAARDDQFFEMKRATWTWGDPEHLSDEFTRECLRLGIVPDLVHVQEHARWKVYELCAEYKRPVVLSHNGLQHFFNHEYNLSDAEVLRIRELGGVIGLILCKRWLLPPEECHYSGSDGIHVLIDMMRYLRDLTGDVSVIGIGTDFDGLTHPFTDCCKPDELGRLAWHMRKHFTPGEIDDILWGNSLRVFRNGWV